MNAFVRRQISHIAEEERLISAAKCSFCVCLFFLRGTVNGLFFVAGD